MAVQRHLSRSGFLSLSTRAGFRLVAVSLAAFLFVAACNSGSDEPTTGPATATALSTASPTPTLTPQTSSTPLVVTVESCNTSNGSGSGGLGTAPGPLPTATPSGSRDNETVRRELGEYFSETLPLIEYMELWNASFNGAWADSLSSREQAERVQVISTRMTLACDAVSVIEEVPPEAAEFDTQMRQAIRDRHAWIMSAADDLNSDNEISPDTDAENEASLTQLFDLSNSAAVLTGEYGVSPGEQRRYVNEAIAIELDLPEGWVASADGLSPVLMAPFEQNLEMLSGLGPDQWQLGTAIRVRRLRNSEPINAQEASERFNSVVERQGPVASTEETSVDGNPALRHTLDPEDGNWQATVTVIVAGDFTYFVETGCPVTVAGACDAVEDVAGSLVLPN